VATYRGGQASTTGLRRGDPVEITGGRFAGKRGEYVGAVNSRQIRVAIGGGTFAVRRRFVHRDAA
jgi:ribosomal protein L24